MDSQHDNIGSYSANLLGKRRKPKPFSVMLDIYPITDIMDQNKKTLRKPQDDFDPRIRPKLKGAKFFTPSSPSPIPLVSLPSPMTLTDEEEKQQMIFHLNLYPRRKNKLNRYGPS